MECLKCIREALSLENPIKTKVSSQDNKMFAVLLLDKGFYQSCRVEVASTTAAGKSNVYFVENYPVTEFQSILSIVTPMIPKLEFLAKSRQFINRALVKRLQDEMLLCEDILTIRRCVTNSEICQDWIHAVNCEAEGPNSCYLSIFPFRDSLYVTLYEVKETTDDLCQIRSSASPFMFEPMSVIQIDNKRYRIIDCVVAKKSQQFLAQVLTWIRLALDELTVLNIPKRTTTNQ